MLIVKEKLGKNKVAKNNTQSETLSMNIKFNYYRKSLLLVILLAYCQFESAQIIIGDPYLDVFASTNVNSIDEFMRRFNGEEFHPDLDTTNKENLRVRSILTLFDLQKFQVSDSIVAGQLVAFADTVYRNDIYLSLEGGGLYAEACCMFSYKQQEIPINLIFVFENIRDDYYKWAIAGANGLIECELLDTICNGYINPTQHGVHFTEMSVASANLTRFVSVHKTVDQLSYFLGLLKTGQFEYVSCNKVRFHFIKVPGYVFIVDEINRLGNNSGYLINTFFKIEDVNKLCYINKLLGQNIER